LAGALSVLVLEDHPLQRSLAAMTLADLGVEEVLEASDGHEAMSLIQGRAGPVDIVLCDLMMDGMDGIEFIRRIGAARLASCVALASGLEDDVLRTVERLAAAEGVTVIGRLPKPLARKDVEALLRRYRERQCACATAKVRARAHSIEEIEHGLASDQFVAWFQPKVSFRTGAMVGVEALARWMHPTDGIVAPGAFVPVLEEQGRIEKLTDVIVGQALTFARRCLDQGRPLRVAFNISPACFHDTSLPARLRAATRAHGVPPEHCIVEVTETALEHQRGDAFEVLSRLRMYGFRLALDDFGTGWSSIEKLAGLPFTELKIDRAFVRGIEHDPKNQGIVHGMLTIAHDLRLTSVAEGVETRAEWDHLAALGCELGQGYHVARPLPVEALGSWAWAPG
jgi:EAL domain-containing protein (putative c-di-GMP-specific phosphodiesterase class I)